MLRQRSGAGPGYVAGLRSGGSPQAERPSTSNFGVVRVWQAAAIQWEEDLKVT